MRPFKPLVFVLLTFIALKSSAQSPKAIEADLRKTFGRIGYWEEHQYDSTYKFTGSDSLINANNKFGLKLKSYCAKYPIIFDQKFGTIDHLIIKTADDNLLKIYSWDDGTGGTMRYYKNVIQFKYAGKQCSNSVNGGPLFINVHSLKANERTYYLVEYLTQAMSGYFGAGIEFWSIEDGYINKQAKLLKTKSGIKSAIHYAYWTDDKLNGDLRFDEKSRILYIPLTTENEKLTGKYIVYKFRGRFFERIKN